jgi:hypothetical protein
MNRKQPQKNPGIKPAGIPPAPPYIKKEQEFSGIIPLESEEQSTLFEWAMLMSKKHPELLYMFAIPNGGLRHKYTAAMLKKTGVKRGVPDTCLPVARQGFHGLYIELKRSKGSRVEQEQKDWIEFLTEQGYKAVVCHGFDEARETIENYLEI